MNAKLFFPIIIFYTLTFSLNAQEDSSLDIPLDKKTSKLITYQEVVQEEGTQRELFYRCVNWLNNFYKNPVSVTRVRDEATGVIKGQHQFRIYDYDGEVKSDAGLVMYNFMIELKEGRYRYTVNEFVHKKSSRYPLENWLDKNDPRYALTWKAYLVQVDSYMREKWIPFLLEKMIPEVVVEEEEW